MKPAQVETARLFYALWPDEATRAALKNLQNGLHGKLMRVGDLHITLAFLGQQPWSNLPLLEKILNDSPRTGFDLQINRLGHFKRKRIAWAGMATIPDALINLQKTLATALQDSAIDFDKSNDFKPHITLARDADPPAESPFPAISWQVTQVVLAQSGAREGGNSYRILATHRLPT